MGNSTHTIEEYLQQLPQERREVVGALRQVIKKNIPKGFAEHITNRTITYTVPLAIYPKGYHVNPGSPLGFISLASQKKHVALYHMGLYSSPELLQWFKEAYEACGVGKLDMGKSCVRFKNIQNIPLALIGELATKMTPTHWIQVYEKALNR